MTAYTDVFGGDAIYPTRVSYAALAMTANTTLSWGFEGSSNVIADIMDVSSDAARDLTLPDATKGSPGTAILINNVGSYTITVKGNAGATIIAIAAGASYTVYMKTNATAAGTWGYIQSGAVAAASQASPLAGYGVVALSGTLNSKLDVQSFNTNYTTGLTDRAKILQWTGGSGTLTLPDPSTMTNSWFVGVKNDGSGTLTIDPAGAVTIDGASTISLSSQESAFIVTDGVEYLTVGRGRSATTTTEYMSINVAGSGDYTLSGGQQNKTIYNFTGLLTGARNIIVPATVAWYIITNNTTGAYTLTVKTAAGTGQVVVQGSQAILFCDGTNVVSATSSISTPVTVADGGTGANNAASARTNLGASSIGNTIFTAANEAAVRTALSLTIGTDVQAYDADLAALAALASNGIIARTGSGTVSARTITGTANEITVTNGDGVAGAPTLSLPAAMTLTGKTLTGGTFSGPTMSGTVSGGTFSGGNWNGNAVPVAYGGTGISNDVKVSTLQFVIDGGGATITTGVKGDLTVPFACTINEATLLADQSGDIVIDIWKDTYANFPPTISDTITASAKPTLSAAAKATDSTLTGWTKTISAGDTLRFNVDSATTVQRVTLSLKVTRT